MEKDKQPETVEDGDEQMDENYNPEEEVFEGNWKIIDLPEVATGNDDEHVENLWECKMMLYRWDNGQWKERAVGQFRFVKDKASGKIRGILRQNTTNKIMANFYVWGDKMCQVSKLPTHDKSWAWVCIDFSDIDLPQRLTRFCARYTKQEHIDQFKEQMEKALAHNNTLNFNVSKTAAKTEETQETKAEEKKEEAK